MEGLSKEYVIQEVTNHKDRIRDATDRLSDSLYKARKNAGLMLTEKDSVTVRKILHEIVSELSMIGGFCDGWTKRYITDTTNHIGLRTSVSRINYGHVLMLEWWAMRVNGIIIDFNKTPFRLSELKPIFSVLEKALGGRKQDKPS